jgi:hypothetical protein
MSKNALNSLELTIPQTKQLLTLYFMTKQPVFLWGPPGIGKSEVVEEIGRDTGRKIIDVRLAQYDPTDIRGIPFFDMSTGQMRWAKPSDFPAIVNESVIAELTNAVNEAKSTLELAREEAVSNPNATTLATRHTATQQLKNAEAALNAAEIAHSLQNAVLFLDEMVSAPPTVQGAAYQLVLNRKIGEYTLPDDVVLVAAGNRESDKGVTYKMPSPLANRFAHVEMIMSTDAWLEWATSNNVNPAIVGFISAHKDRLFTFDAKNVANEKAFATPRSWAKCSSNLNKLDELLRIGKVTKAEYETQLVQVIASLVGKATATTFNQHFKYLGKLPTSEQILDGVPGLKYDTNEPSAHFSLITSLLYTLRDRVHGLTDKGKTKAEIMAISESWANNMFGYAKTQLSDRPEFNVLMMRMALKQFNLPIPPKNPGFVEMTKKYGNLIN